MVKKIGLGSNIASLGAQRQLSGVTDQLSSVYERLSSGLRINSAGDDAAGLAIADSLSVDKRIFSQGVRNFNDGLSLLSVADAALESLTDITIRLSELAEQAANTIFSPTQRAALDEEAQALSKEFTRIIQSATFNGRNVLSGSFGMLHLQGGYGTQGMISGNMGGAVGTGSFSTAIEQDNFGTAVSGHVTADFNGDGILDIAVARTTGGVVEVKYGNGDGSFSDAAQLNTGIDSLNTISIADLNNDGVLDLIFGGLEGAQGAISTSLGNTDGTFASPSAISIVAGFTNIRDIQIGDLNNDGKADLVAVGVNGANAVVSTSLGTGNGSFNSTSTYTMGAGTSDSLAIGDVNNDGVLDVVTNYNTGGAGQARVYYGSGNGNLTFSSSVSLNSKETNELLLVDFNNDNVLDIVSAGGDIVSHGSVDISFGAGNGSFSAVTSYITDATSNGAATIAVGDINGDGILDVVTGEGNARNGINAVLLGTGNGQLSSASLTTYGVSTPDATRLADLNNDGVLDIVNTSGIRFYTSLSQTTSGTSTLVNFSLATAADAKQALSVFKNKLSQLSQQRSQVGAFMSRLNSGVNILNSTTETYAQAETIIRSADIAEESANLVRLSILQQASSAILAQANSQPQLALRLLGS